MLHWITLVSLVMLCVRPVFTQCDLDKAEVCVKEMEDVVTAVLETTAGVDRTGRMQHLCLDVIKGNNLTQCFINATSECTESSDVGPNSSIQRWERVMQDLYRLCDGACPDFLQRTVNITQCTAIIRFDALYESAYDQFCSSLNDSLQCVRNVSDKCPQFGQLFYDLLPEGMEDTASTICTGGCDKFDQALGQLESCKKYVMDMPEDLDQACVSYQKFKTCIRVSEAPVTCPMFASLMEVLYPQHIFGLYEQSCNQTGAGHGKNGNEDKCGDVGIARINHCLRVFALSWPSADQEKNPSPQQCKDFMTGTRCLEHAGFNECASLREYFTQRIGDRQEQKGFMITKCAEILGNSQPGVAYPSVWIIGTSIYLVLLNLVINTR